METNSNQIKLVIVDDNDNARRNLVQEFAQNKEYLILGEASDGAEALALIEKTLPDVVLFDIVLPTIDGFELIEKINNDDIITTKPKLIALSSLKNEGFAQKAINLGASYYMLKPVQFDLVEKRIKDAIKEFSTDVNQQERVANFKTSKNRLLDEKISNIFITVGIPAHIKGYQFLREAIKMAIDNPEIINSITKQLYPSIAQRFETSASKVERAIRHAIEVAWNRGKIENINNLFGIKVYNSNEKPTNGEFIALVADKMLIEGA